MSMDRKNQYCQDISCSQFDLYIQYNPNQNPSKLFYGYGETDSKVDTERQKPRIANTILKEKNKVGGLMLLDFKT